MRRVQFSVIPSSLHRNESYYMDSKKLKKSHLTINLRGFATLISYDTSQIDTPFQSFLAIEDKQLSSDDSGCIRFVTMILSWEYLAVVTKSYGVHLC